MSRVLVSIGLTAFTGFVLSCASTGNSNRSSTSKNEPVNNGALPPGFSGPRELIERGLSSRAELGAQIRDRMLPNGYRVNLEWPVDEARFVRGYFLKDPKGRRRKPHLGIDLAAPKGTPIFAAHPGRVIYVGNEFRGYGKMVMVEGISRQYATLYAHLSSTQVREGQGIQKGDLLGGMGRTGRATGVHLHFEFRTAQGAHDPLTFLPETKPKQRVLSQNTPSARAQRASN